MGIVQSAPFHNGLYTRGIEQSDASDDDEDENRRDDEQLEDNAMAILKELERVRDCLPGQSQSLKFASKLEIFESYYSSVKALYETLDIETLGDYLRVLEADDARKLLKMLTVKVEPRDCNQLKNRRRHYKSEDVKTKGGDLKEAFHDSGNNFWSYIAPKNPDASHLKSIMRKKKCRGCCTLLCDTLKSVIFHGEHPWPSSYETRGVEFHWCGVQCLTYAICDDSHDDDLIRLLHMFIGLPSYKQVFSTTIGRTIALHAWRLSSLQCLMSTVFGIFDLVLLFWMVVDLNEHPADEASLRNTTKHVLGKCDSLSWSFLQGGVEDGRNVIAPIWRVDDNASGSLVCCLLFMSFGKGFFRGVEAFMYSIVETKKDGISSCCRSCCCACDYFTWYFVQHKWSFFCLLCDVWTVFVLLLLKVDSDTNRLSMIDCHPGFTVALICLKWMDFIRSLLVYPIFGRTVLPTFLAATSPESTSFLFFTFLFVFGSAHAYYAFPVFRRGEHLNFADSLIYSFRLNTIGDLGWNFEADKKDEFGDTSIHYSVRIYIMCCTFIVLLIIMNVYVGLLSRLYDHFRRESDQHYLLWMSQEIQGSLLRRRFLRICKSRWRRQNNVSVDETNGLWIVLFPHDGAGTVRDSGGDIVKDISQYNLRT